MNPKHSSTKIVSFLYLKIFIIFLILLVIISVTAKVYSEISTSSFKNNSFTIIYLGKETYLLSVDKKDKRFSFINLGNQNVKLRGKNSLEMSLIIGSPVNAVVQDKKLKNTFRNGDDFLSLSNQLQLITEADGVTLKRINAYDIYKFMNAARSAKRDNVHNEIVTNLGKIGIDQILNDLLRDTAVHESGVTVEVINGTGVNGLASIFSQMLANGGFNVIEVRSDNSDDINSQIRYNKPENDVVNSLFNITTFETKNPNPSSVADVSIFLGNDLPGRLSELYN